MYRGRIKRIHFIGIGGSGMNGIAEVLINMGYEITGSDLAESETTRRLKSLGAVIALGHEGCNVRGAQCVVYSSAVKKDNPEIREATSRQIPIIPRAEMLAELMRLKYGVAIAGTHGKTTTTSMVASVLAAADIDPTVVTGGRLNSIGANAKLGSSDFLVAEADESDGSFLKLAPTIAVVTNIDREHMDHYSGMEEVKQSFVDFMNKVPFYGCAVICLDHPVLQSLIPSVTRRKVTYGLSAQSDVHASDLKFDKMKSTFTLWYGTKKMGTVALNMPGEHNVYNALASVAVARELGVDFEFIRAGLEDFSGVQRRFQVIGSEGGVTVVDDYGHHPEEIRAVLAAATAGWSKPVTVVFQPHRHSRTRDLFDDFIPVFNDAARLVITDIYAAGEEPVEGVSAEALYKSIKEHGHKDAHYIGALDSVAPYLDSVLLAGEMVLTLGAGDVWKVGRELVELLGKREVLKIK
ncbi:MAG: UDP-N-acetylmuramate--L-alanine ligase [Proteobacteria bacterium]|nr:UDP-N-acetylmuramate--L-alanine ligase [Pseudomonadota bacterium]